MAGSRPGPMTMKRIQREISDLQREEMGGMSLEPSETNILRWKAVIPGPEGSPYEGGVFKLDFEIPSDYPFSAPRVTFMTRIYHMNISDRGGVCVDVLKHNWSPALSLYKVLLSISSLLTDPNPKDPLVPSVAHEYTRNRKKHDSTARDWTRLYAQPPKPQASHAVQTPTFKVQQTPIATAASGTSSVAVQAAPPTASRQTRSSHARLVPTETEVIVLSDDESDPASASGSSRGGAAGGKRKRQEGSEADKDSGVEGRRKRKSDGNEGGSRAGASGLSSTTAATANQDVIVID